MAAMMDLNDAQMGTIDYKSLFFPVPVLTKIHGKPTYKTLYTLRNELQASAQSMRTTLGGGQNGHLGLVMTPAEYVSINATPYVCPSLPKPPDIQNQDAA